MNYTNICNYIFELGVLKKFEHCGTKVAGVKHPDSIAEHAHRTAIIGYILAKEEKANAEKVMFMCLIHDNAEARITDLHKIARRYIDVKEAEMKAFEEQVEKLPKEMQQTLLGLFHEFEDKGSKEALIAHDADMLETAFQAREYVEIGYKFCQDWIDNVAKCLKTKTAKKILKTANKTSFVNWCNGLKKIEGLNY